MPQLSPKKRDLYVLYLRKKETVFCKNIINSKNMQRISKKIEKYCILDTKI